MNLSQAKKSSIVGWSMWLLAAVFYALDYFQHTAPSVLLQPIASSLNTNVTIIGNIMSVYFPIYAAAQIPAGFLLDRFGIKITLSLACFVVSLGLYVSIGNALTLLLIGRILIAMGSAFAFLGALKTASVWLPEKIFPIAVGLTNTIGVLGGILGQPFLNALIVRYDWQPAVFMIAVAGIVLALALMIFLHQPPPVRDDKDRQPYQLFKLLSDKNTWFLALYAGIMVGTVVQALAELYDVVLLEKTLHLSSQMAANISSMIFIGIAVGGPLHGIIARYFQYQRTWMLCGCAATVVLFSSLAMITVFPVAPAILFILYFLIGFFVSSMLLSFSAVRCCYPAHVHASLFAILNMFIGLCGFTFQFLMGNLLDTLSHIMHTGFTNEVFFISMLVLDIPLIASLFFCYKTHKI